MNEATSPTLTLDRLGNGQAGQIHAIDWNALDGKHAARLRNFGFDEGVSVVALHRGPFGADPMAIRVGRMTVAIRRAHAAAVTVRFAAA
ncbi:FeoA family protein [Sphingomicrobium sediminis]|uniref:Ferrous iron transport protein A n=1 Tax=Sphingomicrobium sediminis TaxID=2950949 RepID=A0A9X2J5C8_9SPHN|nr:FeoA family protein [Sphingomicrobium sediminis]MCM8558132.1 ferrous iron transport protein A [Sphingomicrobium sediminis]